MFRPTLKVKETVLKLGLSHLTKRKQTNKQKQQKILNVRGAGVETSTRQSAKGGRGLQHATRR